MNFITFYLLSWITALTLAMTMYFAMTLLRVRSMNSNNVYILVRKREHVWYTNEIGNVHYIY